MIYFGPVAARIGHKMCLYMLLFCSTRSVCVCNVTKYMLQFPSKHSIYAEYFVYLYYNNFNIIL